MNTEWSHKQTAWETGVVQGRILTLCRGYHTLTSWLIDNHIEVLKSNPTHRQTGRQTDGLTDSHAVAHEEHSNANCNADRYSQYNNSCQQPWVYFQWTSLSPTEWWHPASIHISVQLLNQWIPSRSIHIGCVHTSIFRTRERCIGDGHSATTLPVQASDQHLCEFSHLRITGNVCMACHGKIELNQSLAMLGAHGTSHVRNPIPSFNNVGILCKIRLHNNRK